MRLFHFSDDPSIAMFTPRPVRVPAERPAGREWLNGPLVWAIDEWTQAMYLFPRDCPRILVWRKPTSSAEDVERWWGARDCRMIAHVEWAWFERLRTARLYRYELPTAPFEDLHDAGMWVSRTAVEPLSVETLDDLPSALAEAGVELRLMHRLTPLRGVWDSSLHASGVRLRNAQDWGTSLSQAGYSGTPLARKLGIKPGSSVLALDAPADYRARLTGLPDGVRFLAEAPAGGADLVHLFAASRADFERQLPLARKAMKPGGALWVSWPKKASKVATDLTEQVIRQAALAGDLVDVKVCAVSTVWSGLKLVVRQALRRQVAAGAKIADRGSAT